MTDSYVADDDEIVLSADNIEYLDEEPTKPVAEFVYFRRPSTMTIAWLCFIGGIAMFMFAAIGFAAALIALVGQIELQFMVTGPTLVGVALVAASRHMARTPTQVTVGPDGICIDHDHKPREKFGWDQIAWAAIGNAGMLQQRQLLLYDRNGKTLAGLSDSFEDFKQLIKQVQRAVARKTDADAEQVRLKKARTSAVFLACGSVFLSVICVANFWMATETERTNSLFDREATDGEAEIVRRFVAPNGVTKRLEYRVAGANGQTATRNVEVTDLYWDSLNEAMTVPVRYVPGEPAVSRLVAGEVTSKDWSESPGMMKGLSLILGAFCLLGFLAAAMQWSGWDIDLNSQSGKISIKRFGTGQ
jgi:hypothetical protein